MHSSCNVYLIRYGIEMIKLSVPQRILNGCFAFIDLCEPLLQLNCTAFRVAASRKFYIKTTAMSSAASGRKYLIC